MINEEMARIIDEIGKYFPEAFINLNFELVLEFGSNTYFSLIDIKTKQDIERKMLSYVSRRCCGRVGVCRQNPMLRSLNSVLGTDFDEEQIELIYKYLGNGRNDALCVEFIKSGYDLKLIEEYKKRKTEG